MTVILRVLWFPVGAIARLAYRACDRLFGASRAQVAFGWLVFKMFADAETAVRDAGGAPWLAVALLAITVPFTMFLAWQLNRLGRGMAAVTGALETIPFLWAARAFIGGVFIAMAYSMVASGQWQSWPLPSIATATMLCDDDPGSGEPVAQRAWRRLVAFARRPRLAAAEAR